MGWITLIGLVGAGLLMTRYWYVPFLRNPDRIDFKKLGLRLTTAAHRQRVRDILTAFFGGFNAMLKARSMATVRAECQSFSLLLRPFAHEGAAMAFGIKAILRPWGRATGFEQTMRGLSREFYLMYNIGLGFSAGVMLKYWPSRVKRLADQLHPFYQYLCYDGFGFKTGLFDYLKRTETLRCFSRFEGYSRHACFQGFGRSLWFLFMDDPVAINETIAQQDDVFKGDCYSGVGLAVTFTNMDDLRVAFNFSHQVVPDYLTDYFLGLTIALYTRREIDKAYLEECLHVLDVRQRGLVWSGLQSCDRHFADVADATSGLHYAHWRERITNDLRAMLALQTARTAS